MSSERVVLDADHRGPLLNIISWIFMIVMLCAISIKGFSKWVAMHSFQLDDVYMVFSVGVTIAVSLQVAYGLGSHMSESSADNLLGFQQVEYAWEMFYIWSLGLAKMSLLQMLSSLSRTTQRKGAVYTVGTLTLIVTVIFTFAVAFQCRVPETWRILSTECINQTALWNAFGVVDIAIDLATVALPIYLLHDLQMRIQLKIPAILAFTSRSLIIPFIVVRLVFLNRNHSSPDQSFDEWTTVVFTIVHVNVNIIFTCIPFLKQIVVGMQSGILASDLNSLVSDSTMQRNDMQTPKKIGSKLTSYEMSNTPRRFFGLRRHTETSSQSEMIIKQTNEVNVHYVPADPSQSSTNVQSVTPFANAG